MEYKNKKILLTGGSGNLGSHIIKSGRFRNMLAPNRAEMDITKAAAVEKYLGGNGFDAAIHCAALARVSECEQKPAEAIMTNIIGTANLVAAVMKKEKQLGKSIRLVHISTDGVYHGDRGSYRETDAAIPYNTYGWTKLGAEAAVNVLPNFCIIRTRFFDPENIKYDAYATDAYTSAIPVNELVKAIAVMLESGFVGTINIGGEKISDYDAYKKFKPAIKPCKLKDIQANVSFALPKDASMDTTLWKRIGKQRI